MLLIALIVFGTLWAAILAVVAGVCASAARGDRAARSAPPATAAPRRTHRFRLAA
jgi:hypothetical protein